MDVSRRSMVLGLVLFAGVSRALLAQSTPAAFPSLSTEQLETFLLKAQDLESAGRRRRCHRLASRHRSRTDR